MSIIAYNFSERGIMHMENDMPCQDSSDILTYGMWKVAVVADGVGSCKHSDEASKIAVKAALKTIYNCFPNNCKEEDIISLIKMAFHCAANSVEMHVNNVGGEFKDYHTTLALALYDGKNLYYGNAGDSGIVALDDYGEYHVVSEKQNNEYDEVITLSSRTFEVGKADYNVIAVFCMTDGLLDWVVPKSLSESKTPVYVPRANFFVQPKIWHCKEKISEDFTTSLSNGILNKLRRIVADLDVAGKDLEIIKQLGNLTDGNLKDDLSVAVLINTNADMSEDEIKWKEPEKPTVEDIYCKKWEDILALHPTVAKREFRDFIQKNNPNWNEDDVDDFAVHIWDLIKSKKKQTSETPVSSTPNKEQVSESKTQPTLSSKNNLKASKSSTNETAELTAKTKSKSWLKRSFEGLFLVKDDEIEEDKENNSKNSEEA
ncbi:MAG: protein phosphatase 2C domain-containing protein [Ruminococcus flavefaciens]|nr:protein phosphatase 2C domain-containing protein [Ruminococcus flavefaciens]